MIGEVVVSLLGSFVVGWIVGLLLGGWRAGSA